MNMDIYLQYMVNTFLVILSYSFLNDNHVCTFWLIWFINQRALYNHALLRVIVVIGIGVIAHIS